MSATRDLRAAGVDSRSGASRRRPGRCCHHPAGRARRRTHVRAPAGRAGESRRSREHAATSRSGSRSTLGGRQPRRRARRGPGRCAVVRGVAVVVGALPRRRAGRSHCSLISASGPDDYPGPGTGQVDRRDRQGQTAHADRRDPAAADVVKTADAFVKAAEATSDAVQIQPGTYTPEDADDGADALVALLDPRNRSSDRGSRSPRASGSRRRGALLGRKTQARHARTSRPRSRTRGRSGLPAYAKGNPEGFLFPATYDVEPATTAEDQLQAMVDPVQAGRRERRPRGGRQDGGLTPYEVVIVASLLQAEVRPEDFAKVARVIYNRLDAGHAAPARHDGQLRPRARRGRTLTPEDLAADSPYNTYKNKGLPPAPDQRPGDAAIEAALTPGQGPLALLRHHRPRDGQDQVHRRLPGVPEVQGRVPGNS